MAIAGINIFALNMVVSWSLNHVLAHHLQVVHVRSGGGGASPAMPRAAERFGLTKKCVWNICHVWLWGGEGGHSSCDLLAKRLA